MTPYRVRLTLMMSFRKAIKSLINMTVWWWLLAKLIIDNSCLQYQDLSIVNWTEGQGYFSKVRRSLEDWGVGYLEATAA